MNNPPTDIDRLNAWRDGDDSSEPSPEVRARWDSVEGQLRKAFDPGRAQQFVFADLQKITRAPQAQAQPARSPGRYMRWAAMIVFALLLGGAVSFVLTMDSRNNVTTYARVSPADAFNRAVADDLTPAWTCELDELPGRIEQHFGGGSFALAQVPSNVHIIGWTGPYRTRQQVLAPNELVLMARVDGQPVVLLIARAQDAHDVSNERRADGLHLSVRQGAEFVLIEASRFDQPRLLPLIETR